MNLEKQIRTNNGIMVRILLIEKKLSLVLIALFAILLLAGGVNAATTHTVCASGCDYISIQDAIDTASAGDTIEVHSGNYNSLNVNKQIILKGINTGGGKPEIDSSNGASISAEGVKIEGFIINLGIYGVMHITSNNNIIQENDIGGDDGDLNIHSSNNILTNNRISFHSSNAINLDGGGNNILIGNDVLSGWYSAIYISSSNNKLYQNSFSCSLSGCMVAKDFGSNQWDNGNVGNHYSDFDQPSEGCVDIDGNGICDSSHSIPGGSNVDMYPLVSWNQPPPPSNQIPEFPTIALPLASAIGVMFLIQRKKR